MYLLLRNILCYLIITTGCFLTACSNKDISTQKNHKKASFYYWKTTFDLSDSLKKVLIDNEVSHLYIRYFDVDLKGHQAIPIGPINFNNTPDSFVITPVVYIENQVLKDTLVNVDSLAQHIVNYVAAINKYANNANHNLQLDCDWSLKTKSRYLELVQKVRSLVKGKLSATIRLHQIKYFDLTAVPEVDYGVLMYYNMGTIAADGNNSIYDRQIAQRYIPALKQYPLKLEVALPIYSWVIQIRNNKVVNLFSKRNVEDLKNIELYEVLGDNRYKVRQNHLAFGTYLKENDVLKLETIRPNQLTEMMQDIQKYIAQPIQEVIFYDLDEKNIKPYKHEKHFFKKVATNR